VSWHCDSELQLPRGYALLHYM